jgi:hypothetical protein
MPYNFDKSLPSYCIITARSRHLEYGLKEITGIVILRQSVDHNSQHTFKYLYYELHEIIEVILMNIIGYT